MLDQLRLRTATETDRQRPALGGMELLLLCSQTRGIHFVQVPRDEDRWLYATLMLAQKLGEPRFRALHQRIEAGRGEERFGVGDFLSEARPSLCLQGGDWEGDEATTDVYDLADRDARWCLEGMASITGGISDVGKNVEPASSELYPLWAAAGADPRRFALAYAGERMGLPWALLGTFEDEPRQIDAVLARLPPAARALLLRLVAHARAIPFALFQAAFPADEPALSSLRELGIVDLFRGDVLLAPPWSMAPLGGREIALHRELANAFAAVVESATLPLSVRGLSALEAQRHASRSDDPDVWRLVPRCATYGVRSVFREAIRLSKEGAPERARRLYRILLDAHREATAPGLLGRRAYAYVIHYEAENRRRSEEPQVSAPVLAGFRQSLQLWPENMHFWGDSIFALGLRGDLAGARAAREQAYQTVNREHPECDRRLADVPVRRLAGPNLWKAFGLAIDAPEVSAYELAELDARVLRWAAWWTRSLWCPPNLMLAFKSAASITFSRADQGINASFGALSFRGAHATDALKQLVAALADEIEAGLVAEPPRAFASSPLDEELMAVYGPRSRWLAALSSLRNDHGPAARLVRESWRAARGHLAGLIDDRPELTVTDGGVELAWPVSSHGGAQVEVSTEGVATLSVADDLHDQSAPSAARAACLAWLDVLRARSPVASARADDPAVARLIARFGVDGATLWRWVGQDMPDTVVLRDGDAVSLRGVGVDALYWIDLAPSANWAHPCAFVLVGREGAVVGEVPARWPPRSEKDWEVVRAGGTR